MLNSEEMVAPREHLFQTFGREIKEKKDNNNGGRAVSASEDLCKKWDTSA